MRAGMEGREDWSSDSDEENEEPEEAKGINTNVTMITQSFKRSTTMDEISKQVVLAGASQKPLHVNLLAGSIHGNLEGNLKVV